MSKLKIVVLLKTNDLTRHEDTYNSTHVYKIQEMLRKHVTIDYDFYCLTNDTTLNCNIIPLEYNLFGWWGKLELYKIPGPVFFLDLDTVIINNIDNILKELQGRKFSTLFPNKGVQHFNKDLIKKSIKKYKWVYYIMTGLMYWSDDVSFIWEEAKSINFFDTIINPKGRVKNNSIPPAARGDQELLSLILDKSNLKDIVTPLAKLQLPSKPSHVAVYETFPILSFKKGVHNNVYTESGQLITENLSKILSFNKIIYFSDEPRPWQQDIIPY